MLEQNGYIEEDEIDLKALGKTISYRKWSIISITLLMTLIALVFAYYMPNVYQASSTLQIELDKKSSLGQDVLADVLNGASSSNLDTESEVIKSRYLVKKVVEKLHLNHQYVGVNQFYKKIYFYDDKPFQVDLLKGIDLECKIIPRTKTSFILVVSGIDDNGEEFEYKKERRYNQRINNKYFSLVVRKDANLTLDMRYYLVSFQDSAYFADELELSISNPSKKADILKISYSDTNAKRAKDFVRLLTTEYMNQSLERKTKEATFTLRFVNEQLKIIKSNLQKASKQLESFKQENNTVSVKESITQLSTQFAEYENQKSILDMKLTAIKDIVLQIQKGQLETLTLAGIGLEDNSMEKIIGELQQAIIKQKELLKNYTYEHPEVKTMTERITQLKRIITKSMKNILANVNQRKSALDQKLEQLQTKLQALPKQEQDYIGLERNFLFNNKFYTYLMEKKTETEIKKAATISKNRILDLPLLPRKPIKPKRKLIIAVGFILGVILGIFLAFIREFLDNTIKEENDITDNTNIPMLGIIPHYENTETERTLIVLKSPKSPISEAFRNIRTNLQFMLTNDARVISITSTIEKEGKTSIAANLAGAMHLLKKRVVIVNLDLRKPTLHTMFDVANTQGVSNYLSGLSSKVIYKTKYEYIDIVPAGPVPPNPNELIASERLGILVDELKEKYDIVILDTPPIGLVADSKVIVRYSDLTIYMLRANHAKKDFINLPNELYKNDVKIALVLNDLKISKRGYGYGNGYGYGYY